MKIESLWTRWYGMGKAEQDFLEVLPAGRPCGPAGFEVILLEPDAARVAYRYTDNFRAAAWKVGTICDVIDAVDAAEARLNEV